MTNSSVLGEQIARRKEWCTLSDGEKRARWLSSLRKRVGDKAWFEEDMYECPAFFLCDEEQLHSIRHLLPVSTARAVVALMRDEQEDMQRDWCGYYWEPLVFPRGDSRMVRRPLLSFVRHFVYRLNRTARSSASLVDPFYEWWTETEHGGSAQNIMITRTSLGGSFLTLMLEAIPRPITLDALRQIVRDSNWRTGRGCGTPELTRHRAFGPNTVETILLYLSLHDHRLETIFDMAALRTFLTEDGGYDLTDERYELCVGEYAVNLHAWLKNA